MKTGARTPNVGLRDGIDLRRKRSSLDGREKMRAHDVFDIYTTGDPAINRCLEERKRDSVPYSRATRSWPFESTSVIRSPSTITW